jgi:uncharacterized protein with GYD domain
MPKYLFEARYSTEGVRGVAEKGGTARSEAIAQLFEAAGGKMEALYFAFGGADAYVFGDLPDNQAAAAIALTVNGSGGGATVKTVVLLTPEEVDAAGKVSVDYRPPGG